MKNIPIFWKLFVLVIVLIAFTAGLGIFLSSVQETAPSIQI